MSGRRATAVLADQLELALVEHGPTAGTQLARIVGTRKQTVLRELRDARRFERVGRGRRSVWQLTGTGWEPIHGDESFGRGPDAPRAILDALAALTARVDELERRLARLEPAPPAAGDEPLVGQLTVDDALAATNGGPAT